MTVLIGRVKPETFYRMNVLSALDDVFIGQTDSSPTKFHVLVGDLMILCNSKQYFSLTQSAYESVEEVSLDRLCPKCKSKYYSLIS